MIKRFKVKCIECGKVETFEDEIAIKYVKWKILAWKVDTGDPICLCDKCEYEPIKNK